MVAWTTLSYYRNSCCRSAVAPSLPRRWAFCLCPSITALLGLYAWASPHHKQPSYHHNVTRPYSKRKLDDPASYSRLVSQHLRPIAARGASPPPTAACSCVPSRWGVRGAYPSHAYLRLTEVVKTAEGVARDGWQRGFVCQRKLFLAQNHGNCLLLAWLCNGIAVSTDPLFSADLASGISEDLAILSIYSIYRVACANLLKGALRLSPLRKSRGRGFSWRRMRGGDMRPSLPPNNSLSLWLMEILLVARILDGCSGALAAREKFWKLVSYR